MKSSPTGTLASSPALWVSGASLATSFGTAIYLNKQLTAVNDEIQKNSKRLSSAIIEVSRIKSFGDNVKKVAEALRMLNLEGTNQNKLINDLRDIIADFEQIFDALIPQVNNNSHQMNVMFNAINELQDLAKQNGWKIRTNLSSMPAIYPPSDNYPRPNNGYNPPAENVNQYGEPIDLPDEHGPAIQNSQIRQNFPMSDNERSNEIHPKSLSLKRTPLQSDSRSRHSREYSNQRGGRSNPTKNKHSHRKQGEGSVRFSLKSDQHSPERDYHHQHQNKEHYHHQDVPYATSGEISDRRHYHAIPRYRNSQHSMQRSNSETNSRQFRSMPNNYKYRDERRRISQKSPELVQGHENYTPDHETSGRFNSNDNSQSDLNLDGDLNSTPDVGIILNSATNDDDQSKNEILARISL